MKKEHMIWLQANYACDQSLRWVQKYNIHSLQEAWNTCERGDWLLWMAERLGVDKRKLVMCGALCAHTVVQHMSGPRVRDAVRITFLWGRGKATDEQLMAARAAAAAERAARVAAEAAERAAAWAARVAAWAAERAAAWAAEAAAEAAEEANQLRTAGIARKVLTEDVMNVIQTIN